MRGSIFRSRRRAVLTLVPAVLALALVAPARASITDLPCPVGSSIIARTGAQSISLNRSSLLELLDPLSDCQAGAIPGLGVVLAALTATINGLVGSMEGGETLTSDDLTVLSNKVEDVDEALDAGDCEELDAALGEFSGQIESALRAPLSQARTLGKKRFAFSVDTAQLVFDTADGSEVPAGEEVETWLGWTSISYGVSERLDLTAIVPVLSLDIPAVPGVVSGQHAGVGDVIAAGRYRLTSSPVARSSVAIHGNVTAPTGNEARLLGGDAWSGRVGVAADRIFAGDAVTVVPSLSVWGLLSEGGGTGGGLAAAADLAVQQNLAFVGGVIGERTAGDHDYWDGHAGIRVRAHGRKPTGGAQTDATIRLNWSLSDDGFRPDSWVSAGVQVIWGKKKEPGSGRAVD